MKEIWKLIELFKEYVDKYSNDARVLDEWEYVVIDDGQSFLYWTREYSYLTLISKKFWFIKWLVENDKIEWTTLENYAERTQLRGLVNYIQLWHSAKWKSELEYFKELYTEALLMLLSIQDEPIRFLCEILK